jgi:hypothetical protein
MNGSGDVKAARNGERSGLGPLRLSKPHACTAVIVVDKRHSGLFEGALDDLSGRAAGLTDSRFELVDG